MPHSKTNMARLTTLIASIFLIVVVHVGETAHAETNLLTNGDFSAGDSTGWTVIENGGSGAGFNGVYATSYSWNSISQTVDLVDAGYTEDELDEAPGITFNVSTFQRFDHGGVYYLEYKLLAEDGSTVIASKLYGSSSSPIALSASTDWFETEYTFTEYGEGARYAYIKIAGEDGAPNWAGQYGPYFDNAIIAFSDSEAPIVSTFSPVDGASEIDPSSNLVITFSEAVDAESGNITFKKSDGSTDRTIDVTSEQVSGSGSTTITINPSTDLQPGTDYYIQIDATAFDDAAGNSYVGISDSTTWNFRTAGGSSNSTPPVINSISPLDGAADLSSENLSLSIYFDQSVWVRPGYIRIKKVADDSEIDSINVMSNRLTGWGSNLVKTDQIQNLEPGKEYYVLIDYGAFKNAAGEVYKGITDNQTWNFTTEAILEAAEEPDQDSNASAAEEEEQTSDHNQIDLFANPCGDLNSKHWAYPIIISLNGLEKYPLFTKNDQTLCRPDQYISRLEYVKWLLDVFYQDQLLTFEPDQVENVPFSDISRESEDFIYLVVGYQQGLINGYKDGSVRAENTINRAELLAITLRALNNFRATPEQLQQLRTAYPNREPSQNYADMEDQNSWYYPYFYYATAHNIISGKQAQTGSEALYYADPNHPTTYAEAAKILFYSVWGK